MGFTVTCNLWPWPSELLMPQRHHGICVGGAPGGKVAGHNAGDEQQKNC